MERYEEVKELKKFKLVVVGAIVVVGIVLLMILNPFVTISAGHRGIVLNWGAVSGNVLGEGLHLRMPIMQKVVKMDVQTQKMETKADAYSKDIQQVTTTIALNYHVKVDLVNKLYQEVGVDYVGRIIDPAIQESLKAAIAKFTAQSLVEERPKVKDEIKLELNKRLNTYFNVVEFSLTDFEFSSSYEKAIDEKQVAQQNALKAENDLIRIKTEAEQRVAQAKAEAEAIKIQAQAITQQGGRDYVQLKAIEKWNGVLPTHQIPNASVPFLDLQK